MPISGFYTEFLDIDTDEPTEGWGSPSDSRIEHSRGTLGQPDVLQDDEPDSECDFWEFLTERTPRVVEVAEVDLASQGSAEWPRARWPDVHPSRV